MKTIVTKFNGVGPGGTRFGVVMFSATVTEQFPLTKYQNKEDILKAIDKIQPTNGGQTAIGAGLQVCFI